MSQDQDQELNINYILSHSQSSEELDLEDVVPETGMSVEVETEDSVRLPDERYCFCNQHWGETFMIMCDHCHAWFHGRCINLVQADSLDIDKYHCTNCEPIVGPTTRSNKSIPTISSTSNSNSNLDKAKDAKPIQAGTAEFIQKLRQRIFVSADEIVCKERGQTFNMANLINKGFNRPVLVDDVSGLEMKLPPDTLTVKDVERFVGPNTAIEVIDVEKQSSKRMILREFIEYFQHPLREKRYNLLSLEVSDTPLGMLITPPYMVRKMDWVLNSWPKTLNEELYQKPKVSKYCLISAINSYTDFHIDFGGTSVWYHVLWGEKTFYLIEPTDINLALYQKWMSSSPKDKYESFFADTVDYCYKLTLKKGQTMFIPTGWIHAVLTNEDSLVFGGNFLHSLNMELQLKIYNLESNLNIRKKYMYPSFQTTHWLAASYAIADLKSYNDFGMMPIHFRRGATALVHALKEWSQRDKKSSNGEQIPPHICSQEIIKGLQREIKRAEKRVLANNSTHVGSGHSKHTSISAEILHNECNISTFSGALLTIAKPSISPTSQSQDDDKSLVSVSPSSSSQHPPPIKLKLMKNASRSASLQSSPSYSSSLHEDGTVFTNGASHSPDQTFPKDGTLKIRLSLSESRVEVIEPENHRKVPSSVDSTSDHLHIDTDSEQGGSTSKKHRHKGKSHGHKCKNHHKRKELEKISLNDALQGAFNGMEQLIESSNFHDRVQSNETMDTSVKEAIADMQKNDEFFKKRLHKKKHKSKSKHRSRNGEDGMGKVHQDQDYIYPSLTASDDEDMSPKKKLNAGDELWSPGGKVSTTLPNNKIARLPRPGAKREAVEKGLKVASAKLSSDKEKNGVKRKYTKNKEGDKSPKKAKLGNDPAQQLLPSTNEVDSQIGSKPSTSTQVVNSTVNDKAKKKFKKGMATPKQRLSKILGMKKLF